ncbi:5-oxoprolinase subunit C family protein [Shewanella cyperi]|uniref:5-oxoprolinase subunit C family protein n=1 Tax=Shewanella cyperi TaxID=2814292 RepID=UPI001A952417|nr:biotin-dependent carboxyltransferase family protein [Shewanella cyperi]QSX40890.1 biotin-dependent carboxyltransferase family protein [Shewanella cyperi]
MIEVIQGGVLASVQDLGRHGVAHLGVPISGALDRQALMLGNLLLGNEPGAAAIEITLGRASFRFLRDGWIALTGADADARLDDQAVWCGWRVPVHAGQQLSLNSPKQGMRSYLCVAGGLDCPLWFGAMATDLSSGMGGLAGRALQPGDKLNWLPGKEINRIAGLRQPEWNTLIRVLPGPQFGLLANNGEALWQQELQLGNDSNRMGLRLQGRPLQKTTELEMASHGVFPGVVQLPPSGQPIILLADAQTTGGYPVIATVIEADLWKLAQARPGQKLQLQQVERADALSASKHWQAYLYQVQLGLGGFK